MSFVFLFQGDSITDCARSKEKETMGSGYVHLIAAHLSEKLIAKRPQFFNRGISGHRVSDLYARWNEDTYAINPQLLSILIGVNDAWRIVNKLPTGTKNRFSRSMKELISETVEELPNCALVLMEPFILKTKETESDWELWTTLLEAYRKEIQILVEKYDLVYVPLQALFDKACEQAPAEYWLYDGIHPSVAGHQLIATQWLDIVANSKYGDLIK